MTILLLTNLCQTDISTPCAPYGTTKENKVVMRTFACTLTVHPPVSFPLFEVIIVELLALHLLDLVLADTLPHDVGDRCGDQTKMDVNLHSRNRKHGWCRARQRLQYI